MRLLKGHLDLPLSCKTAMFFSTVVHPSFVYSKAAACAMYTHLPGDHLPRGQCKGKNNAIIMAEMALATQDFDIIHELRKLNSRPKKTTFDYFLSEIKSLLEVHVRVDDRRHGKVHCFVYAFYGYFLCVCLCLYEMHAFSQ